MKRYPRILYFIKGVMPSAEAQEVAEEYGPNVAFRNANFVPSSGALEACDGVAGDVPETYKNLPTAEEAIEKFEAERKAANEKNAKRDAERKEQAEAAKAEAEKKAKEQAEADAKKAKEQAKANENKTTPAKANKPADWKPNA